MRPRLAARSSAPTSCSRRMGERARAGDGVVGGAGRVDGRPVFCYAQDPSFVGGSLGEPHADTIVRVLRLAGRARRARRRLRRVRRRAHAGGPRGARRLRADLPGEHVALSGRVPQISVITGASAGGGSYSPALTDFVVMTERGDDVPHRPRRRAGGHGRGRRRRRARRARRCTSATASATSSRATDVDAALLVRDLLDHLPAHAGERAPRWRAADPPGYEPGRAGAGRARARSTTCATSSRGDRRRRPAARVRAALGAQHRLRRSPASTAARSASIANQPRYLGGVLDADAAAKGARFVRTCNAFGLPLVVLVDTPGFMPGTEQEQGGVIRHGAKLVHAFAEATRAEGDRRAAQGVRRRVHRDELARPRRGLRVRLAPGAARRHGRPAGGRDRPPARHRRRRRPARPRASASPTSTPTSTSSAGVAAATATSTRSSRPHDTRRRLVAALSTLTLDVPRLRPQHPACSAAGPREEHAPLPLRGDRLLHDKKLLITGVITRDSIACHVARQAQEAGRRGRADRLRPRASG